MSLDDLRALVAAKQLGSDVAISKVAGVPAADAGPLASLAAWPLQVDRTAL